MKPAAPMTIRRFSSCLALWAVFSFPCLAERRALLIGVGKYPGSPATRSLEGPPRDVAALRDMLIKNWGFRAANIVAMTDVDNPSRARILAAIDLLGQQVHAGDQVFIFYSGHGTSSDDLATRGMGLDSNTGAIVPGDIKAGSAKEVYAQLIVASRDLRQRFKTIEAKAETLVIFDACYSGESVKGIARSHLVPRYTDFGLIAKGEVRKPSADEFDTIGTVPVSHEVYPYNNLLYISASAKSERSWDIPLAMIKAHEIDTFDHQAHGALTDSLLRGLSGQADTDHNGIITYRELYQFVLQDVQPRFSQQPQFLAPPSKPELSAKSLFGATEAPRAVVGMPVSGKVRVKLDVDDVALTARLRALDGIEISQTDFDLRVARERDGYALIHGSGTVIQQYLRDDLAGLMARIALQPQVKALADYTIPKQSFNIALRIDPPAKEVFYLGDRQYIYLTPDVESYLLLVNIDVLGKITVIYPMDKTQTEPIAAGHEVKCVETEIDPPVGTEYLKAFAFRQKPKDFDSWAGRDFLPTQPSFPLLLDMVRRGANSQYRFISFSTDKRKPD